MADVINESAVIIDGVTRFVNPFISKIVIAVIILLVGLIIGKLLGNLIRKALSEVELDKHLRAAAGFKWSMEKGISSIISYFIYLVSIILSLNSLGLTTAILVIIAVVITFVITLSFLLAIKDFFPNLLAGIRIRAKHLFSVGDEIQIKEVKGIVVSLGYMETRLTTSFKEEVIIPNSIFNKRQIVVRKKSGKNKKGKE